MVILVYDYFLGNYRHSKLLPPPLCVSTIRLLLLWFGLGKDD